MISRIRKERGLSEVVSTLILLVVAVLLAAVATYYATNITLTRTEIEEIRFSKEHVWVNSTGAVAAFKLQNLGGKDILVDKFTVRGVEAAWSNVY
jgi:flagellin-like protein